MKKLFSLAAIALASGSFAGTAFFSGELSASSATFNRPEPSGIDPSGWGTEVAYSVQPFSVSVSGEYSFETLSSASDSFAIIYKGSFDPTNPTANFLLAGDDWYDALTFLNADSQVDSFLKSKVGDDLHLLDDGLFLDAGVNYYAVNTTYNNGDYFKFDAAIGGVNGTVGDVSLAPVPEPASMLALGGGLLGLASRRKRK